MISDAADTKTHRVTVGDPPVSRHTILPGQADIGRPDRRSCTIAEGKSPTSSPSTPPRQLWTLRQTAKLVGVYRRPRACQQQRHWKVRTLQRVCGRVTTVKYRPVRCSPSGLTACSLLHARANVVVAMVVVWQRQASCYRRGAQLTDAVPIGDIDDVVNRQ